MATPIILTEPHDTRLEPFRAIRERDLVGRQERFIAEGEVVLRVLTQADHFVIETVLISLRVMANGREWLETLAPETQVFAVSDDLIEQISGFHVHRGILALGRRRTQPTMATLLANLPARAIALACIGIANHDNMGGIFRNAAAFGVAVVLCDATCCDPLYRKAIRVSVGGVFKVPFVRGGSAVEIVTALQGAGFTTLALSPGGHSPLHGVVPSDRAALVLGAEGPGLPPDVLNRMATIRIAMAGGFDSLNVATTSGIALHLLFNR